MGTPISRPSVSGEGASRGSSVGEATTATGTGTATGRIPYRYPTGLAIAANGDCIVANTFEHSICRQSDSGFVCTIAGEGSPGFSDGKAPEAMFHFPEGVAVDDSGVVYVADCDNHALRAIAPTGDVTTIAGCGKPGYRDGRGSSAAFDFPRGVALDLGDVVVADGACIRRVSLDGDVRTISTSGFRAPSGAETNLGFLGGIAVDPNGDILLTDTSLHALLVLDRRGNVFVLAGGSGPGYSDGWGQSASFDKPRGLCVDQTGRVYIADSNNNTVRVLLTSGKVETLRGEDFGIQGGFSHPASVAITRDGSLFVSDQFNDRVCRLMI